MTDEVKNKISELEKQLTPRGAFEAARWGTTLPEGRRFCETYAQIRELEGDKVTVVQSSKT